MQPIRDIVLIQADEARTQTDSGLYVQEDWKSLPQQGKVLEVGPLVKTLKKGDKVLFNRYASIIIEKDKRFCKESQISAII